MQSILKLTPIKSALLLALIGILYCYIWRDGFKPGYQPDSVDYLQLSYSNLLSREALSSFRTIGYPLFLKIVRNTVGIDSLPLVQWAVYSLAIILIFLSLVPYRLPLGALTFTCAGLYFSNMTFGWQQSGVVTDHLGLSFAMITIAFTLFAVRRKLSFFDIGLAACSFATIQIRPAYLFLLPFVPTLGFLLQSSLLNGVAIPLKERMKRSARLGVVVALPFLLFCSWRFILFKDFRLVNFGGSCLFGLAGQILSPEMVPDLPEGLREAANFVIDKRDWYPGYENYGGGPWTSPLRGRFNVVRKQMEKYQWYIGGVIGWAALKAEYKGDEQRVNRTLEALSWEIIKRRPIPYFVWIAKSMYDGMLYVWNAMSFIYPMFFLWGCFGLLLFRQLLTNNASPFTHTFSIEEKRLLYLSLLLGCGFFFAKIGFTILVNPAIPRYCMPAMIFLPMIPISWLALVGTEVWESIMRVRIKLRAQLPNG